MAERFEGLPGDRITQGAEDLANQYRTALRDFRREMEEPGSIGRMFKPAIGYLTYLIKTGKIREDEPLTFELSRLTERDPGEYDPLHRAMNRFFRYGGLASDVKAGEALRVLKEKLKELENPTQDSDSQN